MNAHGNKTDEKNSVSNNLLVAARRELADTARLRATAKFKLRKTPGKSKARLARDENFPFS